MKQQQQQQQQQQTVFPQQLPNTSVSQITPVQPQASTQSVQAVQNKAAPKAPLTGKSLKLVLVLKYVLKFPALS